MKLEEIYQKIEETYPLKLSQLFAQKIGIYDNSGIIVNHGQEITGILFTLDLTKEAVQAAIEKQYNCIITHHPVIFKPIYTLSYEEESAALLCAIQNKINIISMHLNADSAEKGIDYFIARGLGELQTIKPYLQIDKNCFYGRIFRIKTKTLKEFKVNICHTMHTNKIWTFGDKDKKLEKVASFCGAGIDNDVVQFVKENQADAVVSADIKHNILLSLLEADIAVVQMTHYANENYGFYQVYAHLRKKFLIDCNYHHFKKFIE